MNIVWEGFFNISFLAAFPIFISFLFSEKETITGIEKSLSSKLFNICISFVSQLLKEMKPSSDKEIYLYNKLKGIVEKDEKEKAEEKK